MRLFQEKIGSRQNLAMFFPVPFGTTLSAVLLARATGILTAMYQGFYYMASTVHTKIRIHEGSKTEETSG